MELLECETHDFAQHLLNIQTFFSEFQGLENPRNATSCGASIFWALPLRPRAIVVLGVHRSAFAQQKLRRRDVAVARRVVQRRLASGGFFRGPSAAVADAAGNDERCGQLTSTTRSTDKRGMNLLDSTSSKLFKAKNAKIIHKQSQTHRTSFNTSFRQITFNETISIVY